MSVNIQEQFQKMGLGEKIILIAGPLLFIDSFLKWFSYDIGFGSVSRTGWSGGGAILSILAVLIALAMVGQIAVSRFTTMEMPTLPQGFTWARVHLGGAAIVAALIVLRFLIGESTAGFDADRSFGLFIAIVLAAALVAGGFLLFQEEQKSGSAGADAGPSM